MFCCCRGMGHQERQHTVHDGLHYFCTWTQGQSTNPWQFVQPKTPGSEEWKRRFLFICFVTRNALYCQPISFWSCCVWQFFDTEINAGAHDMSTQRHKQTQNTLWLHLGSASATTAIIYAEWPRAVITGSPSASISVTSRFSLTLLLSLLRLLSNDIWPREGTQHPGKLKPLKDSS